MSTTTISRAELIAYIKKNEPFYFGASFEGHTLEQLVIIKTEVELKLAKKKASNHIVE